LRAWIRRALTRARWVQGPHVKKLVRLEEPPPERLVLAVQFCVVAVAGLFAVQVACIVFLKTWNGEVFAAITGLVGVVTGVLLGREP